MSVDILIRKIRIEKGYTLDKLAKLSGLSKGHLSKIERGETRPTIDTLAIIALALKVEISILYKVNK